MLARSTLALALGAMLLACAAAQPVPGTLTAEEGGEEYNNEWASLAELFEQKNNTQKVAQLVDAVADSPAAAALVAAVTSSNFTATVFLPRDEDVSDEATAELLGKTPEEIVTVLAYHVIPGLKYQIGDFYDGQVLQTLLPGPEGQLVVKKAANSLKPSLLTTSGQEIPIFQYKMLAGDAEVYTVKGVLLPGDQVPAAAPGPALA